MKFSQARMQIAIACRRFYRLSMPYLGIDLELRSLTEVVSFSMFLQRNPQLGPHIRTCTYRLLGPEEGSTFGLPSDQWSSHIADLEESLAALHGKSDEHAAEKEKEADRRRAIVAPGRHGIFSLLTHREGSDRSAWGRDIETYDHDELTAALRCAHLGLEFILSASPNLLQLVSADDPSRSYIPTPKIGLSPEDIEDAARFSWRSWQRALPEDIKVLDLYFEQFKSDYLEEACRANLLRYKGLVSLAVRDGQGRRLVPGQFGYTPNGGNRWFDAREDNVQNAGDRPSLPSLVSLRCDEEWRERSKTEDESNEKRLDWEDRQSQRRMIAPFLHALRPLHLPSLRHLDLRLALYYSYSPSEIDSDTRSAIISFLDEHGRHLRELKVNFADAEMQLLAKTPLLEELYLEVRPKELDYAILVVDGKLHHLKKILIGTPYADQDDRHWFSTDRDPPLAEVNLDAFPALREFHAIGSHWPTCERELRKDKEKIAWVTLAERLGREYGVKLKDAAGVHWVPRLAASGSRG